MELYFLPLDAVSDDQYVKVGHFSFENVQRPGGAQRMRELKSVHFDVMTQHLKMVLYNPHHNKENIFQQVGLISISVVGESLGRMQRESTPINIAEPIPQKVSAEE